MNEKKRCAWANANEREQQYHDEEWGRELHDDQLLFELLILEGMQAGLSWDCILSKRENFREAFDGFVPEIVAAYGPEKEEELLANAGIIRNRAKIKTASRNARAFLAVQEEFGSFDAYLWSFVDGKQIQNEVHSAKDVPAQTELSQRISDDLKKRDFRFVGPTIVYAYMQSAGLVNDHEDDCFYKAETEREEKK